MTACHFVIPDAHFSPSDQDTQFLRARRLGHYLAMVYKRCRQRGVPLRVICLGDWWDLVSLCFYEKNKAAFAQQSVVADMQAGETALAAMHLAFEERCAEYGISADENIEYHFTNGNHEHRINTALEETATAPLLRGMPTPQSIVEGMGWRFYPYMQPACIDGVAYAHCLPSGVQGRPIGGANIGKTLLDRMMTSCVVGHSHTYDMTFKVDAFGGRRFALVAGCYYDKVPNYAQATSHLWWRGVTVLNGVENGCLVRGVAAVTVEDIKDVVGF